MRIFEYKCNAFLPFKELSLADMWPITTLNPVPARDSILEDMLNKQMLNKLITCWKSNAEQKLFDELSFSLHFLRYG